MRATAIALLLVGVAAIVFGAIWLTAVFPGLKKIPKDYDQTIDFQGTYAVVADQEFLQSLLTSPSIQQMLSSPETLQILGNPATQQLLAGDSIKALLADPDLLKGLLADPAILRQTADPALARALSDPGIRTMLNDPQALATLTSPATLQVLTNPTVQELIATPGALELLGDPKVQQVLANPGAAAQSSDPEVQALLANPLLQKLVADPATLQLLASPDVQKLLASPLVPVVAGNLEIIATLANPTVRQLLANPALLQLVAAPEVRTILADPVMQQLLGDPAALALLTDPRTLRLLADPTNLGLDEIPVNFHRVRAAERSEGDLLFLHQDFIATVLGTTQEIPQFSSTATLAVDRDTRQYVPGGTEPRRGGFAFPFDVKEDAEYSIWIHEVFDAPKSRFVEIDEVDGLAVLTFRIKEQGLVLPAEPKRNLGIPESLNLTADVEMTTKTEPKTGITVDVVSSIRYQLNNPVLGNPTVFKGEIRYSDASVVSSVDDARDARRSLFWFGIFMPWTAIGLGILLVIGGGSFFWRLLSRKV